ncbi:MAG TPA: hypothetical protein VKZ53_09445 [Candidatus Angelobacter sp.]|nr:hypothetical protein [Candidatus Angelobacter sp.]
MLDQLDTAIGFASVMLLLSMIITVVVQAISALLDLRGNNLVWALSTLFLQITPEAAKSGKGLRLMPLGVNSAAQELAKAVASDSAVTSGGKVGKAKAIRTHELLAILQKLSASPNTLSDAAKSLLSSLTERLPGSTSNTESIQELAASFAQRFPMHSVMLQDALMDIAGSTTRIAAGINRWFHTVMDRGADRFARNCRIWTIVGAAVLAFGFHVDTLEIYRNISSNTETRSKLVAASSSITQMAEKSFGNLGTSVISDLKKNEKGLGDLKPAEKAAFLGAAVPSDLANCSQVRSWLQAQDALKTNQKFAEKLNGACTTATESKIRNLAPDLSSLSDQLESSKINLLTQFNLKLDSANKLGGEFLTVLLLSLGAPFWFNALRQLSNLKPSLSNKVDQETTAPQPAVAQQNVKVAAANAGN